MSGGRELLVEEPHGYRPRGVRARSMFGGCQLVASWVQGPGHGSPLFIHLLPACECSGWACTGRTAARWGSWDVLPKNSAPCPNSSPQSPQGHCPRGGLPPADLLGVAGVQPSNSSLQHLSIPSPCPSGAPARPWLGALPSSLPWQTHVYEESRSSSTASTVAVLPWGPRGS